jgi:stress-induced morphogen
MFKNYQQILRFKGLKFNHQNFYNIVTKDIIEKKIKDNLKEITTLNVLDTDSGCGKFFSIELKTPEFKDKSLIQQHRFVNEILKEELKEIHSLILKTSH